MELAGGRALLGAVRLPVDLAALLPQAIEPQQPSVAAAAAELFIAELTANTAPPAPLLAAQIEAAAVDLPAKDHRRDEEPEDALDDDALDQIYVRASLPAHVPQPLRPVLREPEPSQVRPVEVSEAVRELTQGKAKTALKFKRPTKVLDDAISGGGAGVRFLALKDITPLEGGYPLVIDGKIVGAIGISGVLSAQDSQIARAGIDALK